jgi:hypothetical protein
MIPLVTSPLVRAIRSNDEAQSRRDKLRANVTSGKHLAAEVMLTFSAPSPDKVRGVPSQRDCARVLGVPRGILSQVDKVLIKKC